MMNYFAKILNINEVMESIPLVESNSVFFTLCSTFEQVVEAMGTPSSIIGDTYFYNYSTVSFSQNKVRGWEYDLIHLNKVVLC